MKQFPNRIFDALCETVHEAENKPNYARLFTRVFGPTLYKRFCEVLTNHVIEEVLLDQTADALRPLKEAEEATIGHPLCFDEFQRFFDKSFRSEVKASLTS